jgi:hypothetical protein
MMIARWVSNSRALLSLEANYLLLLQAVLTSLPEREREREGERERERVLMCLFTCTIWILCKHREGTATDVSVRGHVTAVFPIVLKALFSVS